MPEELLVGGHAFKEMLKSVNPDVAISKLSTDYGTTRSVSKKDDIVKKLKFLKGLKTLGVRPEEAFILHNIPVIPPNARPATVMGGNRIEFADVNQLYKDHMLVNNSLKGVADLLPPEELIKERSEAYSGVKAIMGLGDAISPNARGRGVRGLLRQIAGEGGPKLGFFHSRILSKKQDFSGRATIYAEPNLGFNEVAMPTDMIWTTYKFHILRDLAKKGYDYVNSEKAWKERSSAAQQSFDKVIKDVPIIVNRSPSLMRSNLFAAFPKPITGSTLGINPIHLPFIAADLDGDAVSLYLPQSPEAVKEAKEKLLAQHHVHDARRGLNQSLVSPSHEGILGSMFMSDPDTKQATVKFKTEEEALLAFKNGTIKENTPIEISA